MTRWGKKLRLSLYPGALSAGRPFRVDLSALPVEINYAPSRWLGAFLLFIAVGLVAFALWTIVTHVGQSEYVGLIASIAALIALALSGLSYLILTTTRSAIFGPLDIIIHDVDGSDWRAKYQDMLGLQRREIIHDTSQMRTRYQVIELVHPEAEKTLTLFYKRGDWQEDTLLADYAAILRVPVLPFTPPPPRMRYSKDMRHAR